NLIVSGLGIDGADGSRIAINVPSVGRIPKGAIVERTLPFRLGKEDRFTMNLFTADFTTASRMAEVINNTFGEGTATPLDPMSIEILAPVDRNARVSFLSMVENLTFTPGDSAARVIINSRTGTVVISSHVLVTPAAVSHGNLVVTISESKQVSQPAAAFSNAGNTEVVQDSQINVQEEDNRMFMFEPGVDLNDIVRAVNEVGAAPGDLVAILQALKEAGALRAELIVI
ncbi:MAG TPA: flagellar biosynthesis protein FlgI, partial [Thiotrichales bacterium]|nr:flagellar biosynthesis protein FlgI [Thiotrichales bacterium]